MTTFTCQVYSTITILHVCDTSHDTMDKETENWSIPHFIHHILVHFVLCEQLTDNPLMTIATSQQEVVLATLKEGWQTSHCPCAETQMLHRTHLKGDGWWTDWIQHMHKYQSKQYIHKASHVEHKDTLHCTRQWVVSLGKREERKACGIKGTHEWDTVCPWYSASVSDN